MAFGQTIKYEIKSIKDSIQVEIDDTVKSQWVKNDLIRMQELLNNPDSLFPYVDFDSVCYIQYGTEKRFEPAHWNKIYMDYILGKSKLASGKIDTILNIVRNPLYFKWGECGTPFIESSIVFYKEGNEVAEIKSACSGGQLFFKPDNILARWGILNETGYELFYKVLKKK